MTTRPQRDIPDGARLRRNPWSLYLKKRWVDAAGRPLDRDEQQLATINALHAIADDTTKSGRQRKRALKKYNKARAKFETHELLKRKRFGQHRIFSLLKFLIFFPICLFAGKLTVTGVYDVLWETGIRLPTFGGIIVALGAVVLIWAVVAKVKRGGRSPYAAMLLAAAIVGAGSTVLYIYYRLHPVLNGLPVTTNTDFWHWWVTNDTARHLLYRALPEGLLGGLYWVYYNWNHYKKAAHPHWLSRVLGKIGFACPGDAKPAEAWELSVLLPMVILFAVPITAILFPTAVLHQAGIHTWIHSTVPWHVNGMPNPNSQAFMDKLSASVSSDWPTILVGLCAANFFGRIPAFGVVDDLQQVRVWQRISLRRVNGNLHRALTWRQMDGFQARLIDEYQQGGSDPVGYAKAQLDKVGPTVRTLFRIVMASQLLILVGAYFLYGPPSH